MTLLRFPRPPFLVHPSTSHGYPALHRCRFEPILNAFSSSSCSSGAPGQPVYTKIPARDRVIDFGKYRGKMLGTLPSSYLTWVSKNLRARDYEEWARLADEVLGDPVYRDRLEWESAERVLSGVGLRASSTSDSPAAEVLYIGKRFGWDNEDNEGWSRVDFQLLGTSKGGRIPRLPGDGGGGALGGQKGFQLKAHGHGEVKKAGYFGTDCSVVGRRTATGLPGNAAGSQKNTKLGSPGKTLGSQSHGSIRSRSAATHVKNYSTRISGSSEQSVLPYKNCWVHEAKHSGALNGRKVGYLSKGSRFTVGEEEVSSTEEVVREKRDERRERRRLKREQQMRMLRREVGVDGGGGAAARGQMGGGGRGCSNPFPGRGSLLDRIGGGGT